MPDSNKRIFGMMADLNELAELVSAVKFKMILVCTVAAVRRSSRICSRQRMSSRSCDRNARRIVPSPTCSRSIAYQPVSQVEAAADINEEKVSEN
jgi:hypothetical protein